MKKPKSEGDVKMAAARSDLALRLGRLFRRKPETLWMEKEIRQFKKLYRQGCFKNLDDLTLVEQWYAYERKQPVGYHRRRLYQFLNNFQGELDSAREWREKHPLKSTPKKIIQMPPIRSEPFVPSSDPEDIQSHMRFMLEYNERKQRGKSA